MITLSFCNLLSSVAVLIIELSKHLHFILYKMASRGSLRQPAKPKQMLIFFSVDQTTAVLETTKVKHVIEGDVVQEGATVLVEFGKENFKASVIKLHGK